MTKISFSVPNRIKRNLGLSCGIAFACLLIWRYWPPVQSERHFLKSSDQLILYSLQPESDTFMYKPSYFKGMELFHKNLVLGKTVIRDPQLQHELVSALYDGINASQGWEAACFMPHHGIRVIRGSRTLDVEICFTCMQVIFYENGSIYHSHRELIVSDPMAVFDHTLQSAKVPLGKRSLAFN